MDECIKLAIEKNSGLKSSEAAASAAGEEIGISRSALLPSLSLNSYYSLADRGDRQKIDANALAPGLPSQSLSLSTGEKDSYNMSLTLRQPIFAGGGLISAYQRAEHHAAAADFEHSRQRTLLVLQVRKAYNEALISADREKAAEKGVKAAEEQLRVVQARFAEGFSDREELLRREADLAVAGTRLIASTNRSRTVLGRLRQLTGSAPDEEITVVGRPVLHRLDVALDDLIGGVNDRRDDIKGAAVRVAAADAAIRTARSAYYPQLFVEGTYLRQNETSIARDEIWSVKLLARWSLFEWGRTGAEIRKAVAERNQRDFAKEELSRTARTEIEELWREVGELQSTAAAQEKVMKAEETAYVKIIDRYGEGAAHLYDVKSVEKSLWEAYDKHCQIAASLNSALAALETSASTPLGQWIADADLYRPDFEVYENRIKQRPGTASKPQTAMTSPRAEKVVAPEKPAAKPVDALPAPNSATKKIALPVPEKTGKTRTANVFCLQLGAYKNKSGANELAAAMAPQFSGKTIRVISQGALFKPLVSPYSSAADARKAAVTARLKDYMIREDSER